MKRWSATDLERQRAQPPCMPRSVRSGERLGPEWVLVPLALGGGILVGFHLKRLRQPAARFLMPGRIAYEVAQLVTPQPHKALAHPTSESNGSS